MVNTTLYVIPRKSFLMNFYRFRSECFRITEKPCWDVSSILMDRVHLLRYNHYTTSVNLITGKSIPEPIFSGSIRFRISRMSVATSTLQIRYSVLTVSKKLIIGGGDDYKFNIHLFMITGEFRSTFSSVLHTYSDRFNHMVVLPVAKELIIYWSSLQLLLDNIFIS